MENMANKKGTSAEERKKYQQNYYREVLSAKRKAAAAKRKAAKATDEVVQMLQEVAAAKVAEETERVLIRAEQKRQRDACIADELGPILESNGGILVDDICDDGSSYLTWFWEQVSEFLDDVRVGLGRYDFAAFYNMLSLSDAGKAILRHHGIEPLAGAGWSNFAFINRGDGGGVIKTLVNPPANIVDLEARWNAARGRL
jgi:hypothetical protein